MPALASHGPKEICHFHPLAHVPHPGYPHWPLIDPIGPHRPLMGLPYTLYLVPEQQDLVVLEQQDLVVDQTQKYIIFPLFWHE